MGVQWCSKGCFEDCRRWMLSKHTKEHSIDLECAQKWPAGKPLEGSSPLTARIVPWRQLV